MHEDEFPIDVPLVRRLLERSMPHLAGRPLRPLAAQGSSNALFRLGDDLLVRLPRQPGGSATIAKEARWMPHLAGAFPVAVPEVIAVGEPGPGYPERWSVVTWLAGRTPGVERLAQDSVRPLTRDLAVTLRALRHTAIPTAAFDDPALRWYRGEPLAAMDTSIRSYLAQCRRLPLDLDLDACERVWASAVVLPRSSATVQPTWLHGDLTAENLLLQDERLVAVLDFGGLAVGDPVVDLAVAWEVLGRAERTAFRAATEVDDATWLVGRAWALAIALMTFPYYWRSMPARCAARLATARAVLEDASHG